MLTIRPCRPDDNAVIWDLHVTLMKQVGAYLGDGPWDDDLRDIQGAYFDRGGCFLVGEVGGHVVAMGAFRRDTPTRAEIKRMRTHLDYQGRGFGKAILAALEAEAIRQGYDTLFMETSVVQHAAQHLYLSQGYVETHRGKVQHLDCIWFEKRLNGSAAPGE
ncbi:GNAT family N-acetyltransferase [Aggregatilinea lenta]|uniref:GNAT family N-acetyltransferase n=1 Tax=Aggregatilinea lenta TaxID=913108 RepID=UPI000E5A3E31|nr:GNAT family N-acetyltransferase [Aggregatilinea lenta]